MKKRYIILIAFVLMIVLGSFVQFTKPVLPFIQLPGEVYPGTQNVPLLPGITNTFVATVLSWLIVLWLGISLKARSRTPDEVPSGFYNFFEMLIEGMYNFAVNISSEKKAKDFFPFFMTFLLLILVANWMELVPGVDSIGIWENKPHFQAEKQIKQISTELDGAFLQGEEAVTRYVQSLEATYGIEVHLENTHLSHETEEELLHIIEHEIDEANIGDLRRGVFLVRAPENEAGEKPDDADWTIVPYVRAAATDLNFTLALALVTMTMVQYYGFKYLGAGYLTKFFPFAKRGFGGEVAKNPIKAIDPAVGILELVGEISRIISFAFRLLGNIFAGQILLFVMAFLLPVANVIFFGLEFFVGLIQAAVFAMLSLIFMTGATESHGDDHGH